MGDRGTSTALGYVITLGIAAILVTGLLTAGAGFVDDTREQVVRQELEVVGQHIAGNVETADRLVVAGNDTTSVTVNESFPQRVTGSTYDVELVEESGGQLYLNATEPSVSVAVDVENTTAIQDSRADGGEVAVVYDATGDELVIQNA